MTVRLEGLIEQWTGESLLFVRALPGFQLSGRGADELRAKSREALQAHLDWLVERDLIDPPRGEIELTIVETLDARDSSVGPRFHDDLASPSEEEIENALAVGRAALSDLIDAFESIPAEENAEHAVRTLRHVAQLDRRYASYLGLSDAAPPPAEAVDDLIAAAGAFEEAVDSFVASRRPELSSIAGEEWTLAKALRRRTGHLREHLIDIGPGH